MLSRAARVAEQLRRAGAAQAAGMSTVAAAVAAGGAARRLAFIGVPGLGLGTFAAVTDEPQRVAYNAAMVPVRLGRNVATATTMVADYLVTLRGLPEGEEREAAKRGCHQRGADRLLHLCFKNGGIYIKLGQHLGMLDHLLPGEYVTTMREHMLDRCPVSTYEQVRQTILEDFGKPPEALFASFSVEPIASASLAQVHEAVDHDGQRLAVKVQHRGLRETSELDLATIDWLVSIVKFIAPDVDYTWLVDESRENLPLELNFLHEAANSKRCAANLACRRSRVRGRVVAPAVDLERTSHRVLTMEFVDGVKVTDLEGLKRLGAAPADVAALISETFNEMIFAFGDVHCDPHAANLLVRAAPPRGTTTVARGGAWQGGDGGAKPRGRWQLVLLDHGLYRELDDSFRLEYAGLWHALVFADEKGIRRHSEAMNAGDSVPLFAGMLTQRPWEEITKKESSERLRLKHTQEERSEIQDFAAQYAKEIGDLLARMPRPLLLLLKTQDCLRAVDLALGSPVNSFVSTARECTRALARARMQHSPGLLSRLVVAKDVAAVELRMATLRLLSWWAEVEAWLRGNSAAMEERRAAAAAALDAPAP
ncbi:ABC1 [Micractinium conductrix]|uniref:ABC1 n=1 Tax=Micractinium conductrix TaxID=554055 RepID=A0A2P6VS82_9CHLO|nr:ABC1 [Micractinium conductrix]|eukprot:PSC76949.1 ABC1 [Micractinium conductrix]